MPTIDVAMFVRLPAAQVAVQCVKLRTALMARSGRHWERNITPFVNIINRERTRMRRRSDPRSLWPATERAMNEALASNTTPPEFVAWLAAACAEISIREK